MLISTHTLTWSVTPPIKLLCNKQNISTHTLTWSVTGGVVWYTIYRVISTHTLTWSVTNTVFLFFNIQTISTHTLTWSVTLAKPKTIKGIEISTHTLTWSVTVTFYFLFTHCIFQLTRSRGAWLNSLCQMICLKHFNSHAHVERDKVHYLLINGVWISTHTLTWSVTPLRLPF